MEILISKVKLPLPVLRLVWGKPHGACHLPSMCTTWCLPFIGAIVGDEENVAPVVWIFRWILAALPDPEEFPWSTDYGGTVLRNRAAWHWCGLGRSVCIVLLCTVLPSRRATSPSQQKGGSVGMERVGMFVD